MELAIETSSLVSSVAIGTKDSLLGEITIQAALTHSEQLVPHIDALLQMTGVAKKDIDHIVVSIGPGSFTGLRIGMGTAKALAYGLQIPIIGIMTMEAMAYNAMYTDQLIAVWIDAQKNNIYEALYRWEKGKLQCIEEPVVKDFDESLMALADRHCPVLFMGDGAFLDEETIRETSEQFTIAAPPMAIPRAQSLLLAAQERIANKEFDDLMQVVPYYLRRSEAEVLWEKKHKKEEEA